MNSVLPIQMLWPLGLILAQTFFYFTLTLFILKRTGVVRYPLAGMEYSSALVTAAVLFGAFYLSTIVVPGLFQAYKTFEVQPELLLTNLFRKYSQYFLALAFLELIYGLLAAAIIRLLLGCRNSLKEIEEGNIPASILMAVSVVCAAFLLRCVGEEVITYLTPQFVQLR